MDEKQSMLMVIGTQTMTIAVLQNTVQALKEKIVTLTPKQETASSTAVGGTTTTMTT